MSLPKFNNSTKDKGKGFVLGVILTFLLCCFGFPYFLKPKPCVCTPIALFHTKGGADSVKPGTKWIVTTRTIDTATLYRDTLDEGIQYDTILITTGDIHATGIAPVSNLFWDATKGATLKRTKQKVKTVTTNIGTIDGDLILGDIQTINQSGGQTANVINNISGESDVPQTLSQYRKTLDSLQHKR